MKKLTLFVLLFSAGIYFQPLHAESFVVREHVLGVEGIETLNLDASVGTVRIRSTESDELRVEVEIEGKRDNIFQRRRDVDEIDVEIDRRNDRLFLRLNDEEDIEAHWFIEMPVLDRLDIDMGVGELDIEIENSELNVDMGVGEIDIRAPLANSGFIQVSSGVGDARISGGRNRQESRRIVTMQSEAEGDGDNPITAEVGVGSVQVELFD
ncbi:MAG: hypothetical protein CMP91_11570 [Gammaproteobacteria bacterium]|nr:hypothetical protein [Gammaproteobacteria bacterium]|tara:strand:- start:259928 stop:260557 length:630 start_codon:yes stop_codon:yes gene_type:complete